MTTGQLLYLVLALGAFGGFGATLLACRMVYAANREPAYAARAGVQP